MSGSNIIAISASIMSLLAFGISVAALYHEHRQRRLDNLIKLHLFLHQDELSKARRAIRESDSPPSLNDEHVRRVCSSFDFAGTLVRHNAVDKAIFLDYWKVPLLSLESRMAAIGDQPTGAVPVKMYYRDFYWLIREANVHRNIYE